MQCLYYSAIAAEAHVMMLDLDAVGVLTVVMAANGCLCGRVCMQEADRNKISLSFM